MRFKPFLLATLLAGIASHASPPPAAAFFAPANFEEVVLSPKGEQLAISFAQGEGRLGLYVLDLKSSKPQIKRVALFREVDVIEPRWQHEERLLFSTRDNSEGSASARGWPGLFAVNPDGSGTRTLIERGTSAGREANHLQQKVLAPNHRLLHVPAGRIAQGGEAADEVLVGDRVTVRDGNSATELPLWLNTSTGRTRRVDFPVPANANDWWFDAQGEARIVSTRDTEKIQVLSRQPGGEWSKLTEGTLMGLPFVARAIDERGQLYVAIRGSQGGVAQGAIARVDATTGKVGEPIVRTPGFDFEGSLVQEPETGALLGIRMTTDAQSTVWFGAAMKAFQQQVDEQFPGRVNRIDCRRCGQPDMVALLRSYSDRNPGELYVYRAKPAEGQAAWQRIGAVRAAIDPKTQGEVDFQRIKARDGRDLPVWITTPANAPKGKALPAVVLVHGGPWVRGKRWEWEAMAQYIASRGYLVIEPEFRGSDGYGWDHYEAGWKQFGQAMQNDVADALLWARKQGLASDKACIAGASYGGYSTLMGLVRHPELYRCGIAWVALTDLELYVRGDWRVEDNIGGASRDHQLPILVGDPVKDKALLQANSPILLAAHMKAPLLLAFGEGDKRVPIAHGRRLRDALQEAGRPPQYVVYTGEGHGFSRLSNELDFAARIERFLSEHLGSP